VAVAVALKLVQVVLALAAALVEWVIVNSKAMVQ
jgi:hypothetical protein